MRDEYAIVWLSKYAENFFAESAIYYYTTEILESYILLVNFVSMKYELQPLPYSYDALEPYIDARTMEIHHAKHHQNYILKLNEALDAHPELSEVSIEALLKDISKIPHDIQTAVINSGGGHYNHEIFWNSMSPHPTVLQGNLKDAIVASFGDEESFWKQFSAAALGQFGSGWAWLVVTPNRRLEIKKTSNQDSPVSHGDTILLGIDVWEHAYYLKYQNKRVEYVSVWRSLINWDFAQRVYETISRP